MVGGRREPYARENISVEGGRDRRRARRADKDRFEDDIQSYIAIGLTIQL